MNIREGDILVIGSEEYPIRSVAEYGSDKLVYTKAFQRTATLTASTKRSPSITGGKRGAPATLLTGLKCTPLDPVDAETQERLALDTPHEVKQTFLADTGGFVHLIIEELKR